jgi:16S rRNA (cytidine1402-2'-O)-methyltransferase
MTGILYVVATPIGNLSDISQRALSVLSEVSLIAAEDTRHSQRLMQHYLLKTPLMSLHEHNEKGRCGELVEKLKLGNHIALICDAGTPFISDPGGYLVRAAQDAGIKVVPIPGPCAAVTALSVSGLDATEFFFEGFMPSKASARQKRLLELQCEPGILVFYEAPHRIIESLQDMNDLYGSEREAVVARELTKQFETIKRASLGKLLEWVKSDANQQKGEFVILVSPSQLNKDDTEALKVLEILLEELPVKQASSLAAKITGKSKSWLYGQALSQKS